jgi:predicted nuclease of predicted toxin-antitoxin system
MLLFDENLSRRLPALIADLFPESAHVSTVNLPQATDREDWEHCDYPAAVAERMIRDQALRVGEFPGDPDRAVLILRP